MTPVPFRGLKRKELNISTAGIRKDKVLPEPVFAAPKTSLPANSGGIPRCCISVMVSKPSPMSAMPMMIVESLALTHLLYGLQSLLGQTQLIEPLLRLLFARQRHTEGRR